MDRGYLESTGIDREAYEQVATGSGRRAAPTNIQYMDAHNMGQDFGRLLSGPWAVAGAGWEQDAESAPKRATKPIVMMTGRAAGGRAPGAGYPDKYVEAVLSIDPRRSRLEP